jgi:hypothetical protein
MTSIAVPQDALSPEGADDLKRLGITEVPTHYYEFGGYRYPNRQDAVAVAKFMQVGK